MGSNPTQVNFYMELKNLDSKALIGVGVADVKCVTTLRKLKHFQAQSQGKLIKLITIYVVMINVSFTF